MTWATKIKIKTLEDEQIFEKGTNKVKDISIYKEQGIIEIIFEKDSEFEFKIIPIHNLKSIDYSYDSSHKATLRVN